MTALTAGQCAGVRRTAARRVRHWPLIALLPVAVCVCQPAVAGASAPIHHDLKVELNPARHTLQVEDDVTLPSSYGDSVEFTLHGDLNPTVSGAALAPLPPGDNAGSPVHVQRYRLTLKGAARTFVVRYGGEIYHPLQQVPSEERSFEITPGIISAQGVFLDSSGDWFPVVRHALVTFSMDVRLPGGWDAVSQGQRRVHRRQSDSTRVVWDCDQPQDDVYLVAARFIDYQQSSGDIGLQAFLRSPDASLAKRYMKAADEYIDRYQKLLGPYPYKKFAVVENFWESGYGMPSFTLLGSEVLRFPFILYTSYPHEILHDWWGNGVFVDYRQGNWSEGLTAYLSDHLVQEQQHKGAEYRRGVLQKYTDFVSGGRDFPLAQFTERSSQASEAVGYGKALMFFHMLRRYVGDEAFIKSLRLFYYDNKFKYAAFDDIERAFDQVSGRNLNPMFEQWVQRTGAPVLEVSGVAVIHTAGGPRLKMTLEQVQAGPAYQINVPVAVTLQGRQRAYQTSVPMTTKRRRAFLDLPAAPVRVDVDPQFDVFRRVSKGELPPALSGLFGAQSLLIVLPSKAPHALLQGYRDLAAAWQDNPAFPVEVKLDNDLKQLPVHRDVWLFGWENRFRPQVKRALSIYPAVRFTDHGELHLNDRRFPAAGQSMVFAAADPHHGGRILGWLITSAPRALPGLARKLPHYTKYSYLVFDGDEPQNVVRGMWPVLHSPLTVFIDKKSAPVAMGTLAPRHALMQLLDAPARSQNGHK